MIPNNASHICLNAAAGTYVALTLFLQAEDGIRDYKVTGVQTCALPIYSTKLATTAYVDGKVDPSVLQYLGDATGP